MHAPSRKEALFALALSLGVAGCASAGSSRPPGATADRIVQEEFLEVGDVDGHLAIQRLRSSWLRVRNQVDPPVVYVNGVRWHNVDVLRSLRARGIALAERINATDATTLFGIGHTGGAILITMSAL